MILNVRTLPQARVSVKLILEVDVNIIASNIARTRQIIFISDYDGGTGASCC